MAMDRDPNTYNRDSQVSDRDMRGSNTLAYLIGGLVIALGLLAFLFYDGGNRDVSTTGSTSTQTERPSGMTTPPSSPTAGPAAPMAPAAPTAPATPSAPAPA